VSSSAYHKIRLGIVRVEIDRYIDISFWEG
jgi:hypothetical protein